jgi:SUKH-3 immunity protein
MLVLPESILPFFTKAGWFEGRNSCIKSNNQNPFVADIFTEFGGLNVGEVGAGRDCAKSDVCFFNDANETIDEADDYKHFQKQVGQLGLIADAQHNHMQVLVGENGQFYVFTIPDGKLYFAGEHFNAAMERLLLGIHLLPIK